MEQKIKSIISDSIAVKQLILNSDSLLKTVAEVAALCVNCLQQGGKILFAGNGGSAADAQHLAAELSGRFYIDREPLYAEALHVNTSYLTAVANDYAYEEVYARMVRAAGRQGDVLIGMTTSGNSKNILRAAEDARALGMSVVGMTGETGGLLAPLSDYLINIPSRTTPRIQEGHMLLGHLLCELIEEKIFPK